jgi:hypothetical protein
MKFTNIASKVCVTGVFVPSNAQKNVMITGDKVIDKVAI